MWYAYILKCADQTYYAGVTNSLDRRVKEHNSSALGAKYTRGRRPVKLVYWTRFKTRSRAQKQEHKIKQMSRDEKKKTINGKILSDKY